MEFTTPRLLREQVAQSRAAENHSDAQAQFLADDEVPLQDPHLTTITLTLNIIHLRSPWLPVEMSRTTSPSLLPPRKVPRLSLRESNQHPSMYLGKLYLPGLDTSH